MITVLAVDTSTNFVTCGIVRVHANGKTDVLAEQSTDNVRGHMELLVPHIRECMEQARLTPGDFDAIVVGTGPGPFTGLRVGMATAAAFGDALEIPVHGVESPLATAWAQHVQDPTWVGDTIVLSDARRREWYHARYHARITPNGLRLGTLIDPSVHKPEVVEQLNSEVTREVLEHSTASTANPSVRLRIAAMAGAVAERAHETFTAEAWGGVPITEGAHPTPEGLVLAAMQQQGGYLGLLRAAKPLRALYLRRPDATVPTAKAVSQALDFTAVTGQEGIIGRDPELVDADGDAAGEHSTPAEVDAGEQVGVGVLRAEHAAACAEVEMTLFADESPWSAASFAQHVEAPNTLALGMWDAEKLVGFAILAVNGSAADPEGEIHTIGLLPDYQGRGLSHRLLQPLLDVADRLRAPVFLEVREGNDPAVGLYRRYGFEKVGLRKNYYQPSGANAWTMVRAAVNSDDGQSTVKNGSQPITGNSAPRVILGIESSCDETGVGIVRINPDSDPAQPDLHILADQVASSMSEHARFGGVVPEIASRAHLEAMQPTMRAALQQARETDPGFTKPHAVAATIGPGLAGALLVGAAAAKAYAAAWEVPFLAVNHLGGHVAVDTLVPGVRSDALDNSIALLVSGGHTQILHVSGVGQPMKEMGSTVDDAAGEAYDKVARLLGLGYPGGPIIDRLAQQGNARAIQFPRGMMRQQDAAYDFSFSGLKTAVARYVESKEAAGESIPVEDVCASFQEAVVDVLTKKALRACADTGANVLLLGGGVSANRRLRELAAARSASAGVELHVPPLKLCTDNGVMVAALAAHLAKDGIVASDLTVGTDPGLEVEVPQVFR
ncbi:tRNA (adenosine(37)-N6)-threonylcarbamoyltransferase complex transferase subunit TsaD [uncultured Corynebacterium sp.]|uniref:tRNA (adenosine(37)-N6)-threonylcarbamoyltransferase complex transferase subunit TsaD n=1 Tax=uncultured Corynebacterium sp. TaxID=159447 RepID=UPI0025EF310B|nr:tRNA (adenosine(37)-N6)-threonylcarbamoyltransferase complex transferase subunit TsaD [uncultured Corynebacterium sp.]